MGLSGRAPKKITNHDFQIWRVWTMGRVFASRKPTSGEAASSVDSSLRSGRICTRYQPMAATVWNSREGKYGVRSIHTQAFKSRVFTSAELTKLATGTVTTRRWSPPSSRHPLSGEDEESR